MKNMLIYYGYLNCFNSASNGWDNKKVAIELAKYNIIVLGDGLQSSSHGDYANTQAIIERVLTLNPNILIFGYVTTKQTYANFKTKVDEWDTLHAYGVFMDEYGYDYDASTGYCVRQQQNLKVDYVHAQGMLVMANAWHPEHALDITDNVGGYSNATYNPDGLKTNLSSDDWFLMESLAVGNAGAYEAKAQWSSRCELIRDYEGMLNVAACSVISDTDANGQDKFEFIYISALMAGLGAVGSSDTLYGASSAKSKIWDRPNKNKVDLSDYKEIVNCDSDADVYRVYLPDGILKLDFSSGSEASEIIDYEV